MTEDDIYQGITSTFHDIFDDDSIVAVSEMVADDVDGWDSLAHIRIIVALEKSFGISFTAAEASSFENVGQVVSSIQSKLGT